MHTLSPIDLAFLLAERRHQPLHVGALALFRPPDGAGTDYAAQIAGRLREANHVLPPFNRRLDNRFGMKVWMRDRDMDLSQHFVHLSLPKPGNIRDLLAMVSRVHSAHLDRTYPLWRMYLIEGLEDGRIATYWKIHHSVVDGVAAIRLAMKSMDADPQVSLSMPAPWQMRPRRSRQALMPHQPQTLSLLRQMGVKGLQGVPGVAEALLETAGDIRAGREDAVSSFQAPYCVLNSPISASRRFAAQSYSSERIRAVASQFGATRNDIILAMCGGALRRYLLDMQALPERSLIAAVPVSIRSDDGESGNEIAFALANLGTHVSDPLKRAEVVKGSMDYAKNKFRNMSRAQRLAYSLALMAPGAATLLPGISQRRRMANVVISHVPGPREDIYWQGCKLEGMYPASLVLDGFALNITLISRHDAVDVGILACRRSLPNVQRLLNHLEASLAELETALGLNQRKRRRHTRRKTVSTRAA